MEAQTLTNDATELEQLDGVTEVKESLEGGVAYVLMCEDHNRMRIHVDLLKSDKWTPRENFKNDVSPEHSYVKVTYHHEHLN